MAAFTHSALHIEDDQQPLSASAAASADASQSVPSPAPGPLSTPPAVVSVPRCCDGQPAKEEAVGIIYCAVTELHELADHAECPARTISIKSKLQEEGLLAQCLQLMPREATTEELLMAHTAAHIRNIDELFRPGVTLDAIGELAELDGDALIISGDIYCTQHTSRAARAAAGCAVQAVQQVLAGTVQRAFAVIRPPGHHAESDGAMGFCLFNNVAVAALAALQCPGMQRVLILDWDVHHGNGSQQIFESDPRVLVISLHRRDSGFYPVGVGYASEVGSGPGRGYNVNVPWAAKGVGDADFMAAFELLVMPIAAAFAPQLVLVSAGFDAAEGDPLGQCKASAEGFGAMTGQLMGLAGGRVVCVLEGGYNTRVISECAAEVVRVLLGHAPGPMLGKTASRLHKTTPAVLAEVHSIQQQFWPVLRSPTPIEQQVEQFAAALQLQELTLRTPATRTPSGRTPATKHTAAADALADELGGLSVGEEGGRVQKPKPMLSSSKRPPSARQAAAAAARAAASAAASATPATDILAASRAATASGTTGNAASRAAAGGTRAHGPAASSAAAARPAPTSAVASSPAAMGASTSSAADSTSAQSSSAAGATQQTASAAPVPAFASDIHPAANVQHLPGPSDNEAAATATAGGSSTTSIPTAAAPDSQECSRSMLNAPVPVTSSTAAWPSHGRAASTGRTEASSQAPAAASDMRPAGSNMQPAAPFGMGPVPAAGADAASSTTTHSTSVSEVHSGLADDARGGYAAGAQADAAPGTIAGVSDAPVGSAADGPATHASSVAASNTAPGGAAGAVTTALGAAAAGVAGAMAAAAGVVGAAVAAVGSAAVAGASAVLDKSAQDKNAQHVITEDAASAQDST